MSERRGPRFTPRAAVTAAIEEFDRPLSFGVVSNISDGGACICTDGLFPVGDNVTVQLSFRGEEQPVPMEGYVVWCGTDPGPSFRYGLQWIRPAASRLQRLIRDC
jgi:hypothetical protein